MDNPEVHAEDFLVAAFLSMQPPVSLIPLVRSVGGGWITGLAQEVVYKKCFGNEVYIRFPPSKVYLKSMMKSVIMNAEKDGQEVLDKFYEMYGLFLQSDQVLVERCYKTFTYFIPEETMSKLTRTLGHDELLRVSKGNMVTLRVSLNMLDGDTGYNVWPAGLRLTELLLHYPELVRGYTCLELGSGTGVCGVWLSRLCGSQVVLTDGSLPTLVNLRHNLSINGVQPLGGTSDGARENPSQVECRQLLWETATDDELDRFNAEVIVGADLIYDPTHLVPLLTRLLRPKDKLKGAREKTQQQQGGVSLSGDLGSHFTSYSTESVVRPIAYLAQAIRNPSTFQKYLSMVAQSGLLVVDVTDDLNPPKCLPELFGFDRSQVKIHKLYFP